MTASGKQEQLRLGFLTAIHLPERGYVGGLLITNHFGRPLEFQCTTPVLPNRTQEILYGPTLLPFVLGELIGGTLVGKVNIKPDVILTEQQAILELRNHVSIPVACLGETGNADPSLDASAAPSGEVQAGAVQPDSIKTEALKTDTAGSDAANSADRADHNGSGAEFRLGRQVLRFHPAHGSSDLGAVQQRSKLIPRDANLAEPLDRVREALAETTRSAVVK